LTNVATVSDETRSSAGREFQTTVLEMALKSLVLSIVLVLYMTSFRASADLGAVCWQHETSMQSLIVGSYMRVGGKREPSHCRYCPRWYVLSSVMINMVIDFYIPARKLTTAVLCRVLFDH